jgi:hypothetical protein
MKDINNCKLVYENGDFSKHFNESIMNSWLNYITIVGHNPKKKVWFDSASSICFGSEQVFYRSPEEFSFFSTEEDFHSNPRWGMAHVMNYLGKIFGTRIESSDEYIFNSVPAMKKFKNKKVLIVGGGPSAMDIDWKKIKVEYDYIWTCNKFYLNEENLKTKYDLAVLGPTVDLSDEKLNNYIKENDTTCVFEAGVSPFRKEEELQNFKSQGHDCSYYHLRYFSKLGVTARMICLAHFLKVDTCYFIGFDGNPVGKKHAFEGKKSYNESWRNGHANDIYRRQQVLLWDYLINDLKTETKFQNLGEGHQDNEVTEISKQLFPLEIDSAS